MAASAFSPRYCWTRALLVAFILHVASGSDSHGCGLINHNSTTSHWVENVELRAATAARAATPPVKPPMYVVNLDLPAEQRWAEIGKIYANRSQLLVQYFEEFIPPAVLKILIPIFRKGVNYHGFGAQFSGEMSGYAEALGMDVGYVVAANLVYQLEHIGVNCSNWNNTGPVPGCGDSSSEVAWLSSPHHLAKQSRPGPPGLCTSVVAEDSSTGTIFHARNLDWSLPIEFRELIIDVEFQRGGKELYRATTIVSFVGILAALSPANALGVSYSNDARCQGGRLLVNVLEALAHGAATPCHHARTVFESAADFDGAVEGFSQGEIVDPIYYILGGTKSGQGAVVTRDRSKALDVWKLDPSAGAAGADADGWFRLQTNYDHWKPVPTADDRRTPGYAHMREMGHDNVTVAGMWNVLRQWPTFNPHTDFSAVMSAASGTYDTLVWMDGV